MTQKTETQVQAETRAAAPHHGAILWRNNTGAAGPVRFGLANDNPEMSKRTKSSDLIGIERRIITPDDVGCTLGVFLAVEMKRPGWNWTNTPRERAQAAFHEIVRAYGGRALFATGPEDVWPTV